MLSWGESGERKWEGSGVNCGLGGPAAGPRLCLTLPVMECWFPGPDVWPAPLACLHAQEMGSWGSAKARAQGPLDV